MSRLFGTDGVRGIANLELTPELVFKIGKVYGYFLRRRTSRPRVVVGRDTRISGELLEASLVAGLCSSGVDVVCLGVLPTPGVAWFINHLEAAGGAVVSASHNPVVDNGVKLIGVGGFKLPDADEDELDNLLDDIDKFERPVGADVGRIEHYEDKACKLYGAYLVSVAKINLSPLRIVLDCANGASSAVAPEVFRELGAEVHVINASPDGININDHCGSTHPEQLCAKVRELHADLGLAFDGDADRCLACDETGSMCDGDHMLLIFAKWLRDQNRLPGDWLITTVMANLGLEEALRAENIKMLRTQVGDRYVLAKMRELGAAVGGEQSGHIIFLEHATTGDGTLSGLMLAQIVREKGRPLSELAAAMVKRPQVLVNVRVKDKHRWAENPDVAAVKASVEEHLGQRGRLLVRPSGTESLVRVMAEGPDIAELNALVEEMCEALRQHCAPV